jgi:hypothetical protein
MNHFPSRKQSNWHILSINHSIKCSCSFSYHFKVLPFTRVHWKPNLNDEIRPLPVTRRVPQHVKGKSHQAIILALARCDCAIKVAWMEGNIQLPEDARATTQFWSSDGESSVNQVLESFRAKRLRKAVPAIAHIEDGESIQEKKVIIQILYSCWRKISNLYCECLCNYLTRIEISTRVEIWNRFISVWGANCIEISTRVEICTG